jgi:hypothetical protein
MSTSPSQDKFENTYGRPKTTQTSKPKVSTQTQKDSTHASSHSLRTQNPWFQLGTTLLLIFIGAFALIVGGFFAVLSLAVAAFAFILKRLFFRPSSSKSVVTHPKR